MGLPASSPPGVTARRYATASRATWLRGPPGQNGPPAQTAWVPLSNTLTEYLLDAVNIGVRAFRIGLVRVPLSVIRSPANPLLFSMFHPWGNHSRPPFCRACEA